MKISLVINTSNQPVALRQVFTAIFAQSRLPDEILVADDGSGEETMSVISDARHRLPIPVHHHWQEKTGFRRARILNRCIAAGTGDYVIFLDGDSVPHRHFIRDHYTLAEQGCWVQGRRAFVKEAHTATFRPILPCLLHYMLTGRITGATKAFRLPAPLIKKNTLMSRISRSTLGCNLGIWRDDLLAVNGYDENFTGWGREDSDLAARLCHLGRAQKLVHGRALVFHLNHPPASRANLPDNDALLAATLLNKTIRCHRGIAHEEDV